MERWMNVEVDEEKGKVGVVVGNCGQWREKRRGEEK